MKIKHRYKVNGKEYDRFEDIPEEFRKLMDRDNNGKSDFLEEFEKDPSRKKWKVSINKTEHSNPTQVKDTKGLIVGLILLAFAAGIFILWIKLSF
jgi:hypothetical protein